MVRKRKCVRDMICVLGVLLSSTSLQAESARDVLDRVVMRSFGESFRIVLTITTFEGPKKVSSHVAWVIGQYRPEPAAIFMAFEGPGEQEGLRYLFQMKRGEGIKGFMYDPSVKKTVRLGHDELGADLAGSGLIVDDIKGVVAGTGEKETTLLYESVRGRQCRVILIARPEEKAGRLVWVDEQNNVVVKLQSLDSEGKVVRDLNVVEFFHADSGQVFPREEEITIPGRNMRIRLRQEHGLTGVEIPPEVLDPDKFGEYKWNL